MLKLNVNNFKNDLGAYVVPKTTKEVILEKYLPLTHYLVGNVWKEDAKDSKSLAFAKAVARALTYFFTALTAAPLYQKALCSSSEKIMFSWQNTKYAQAALEALSEYNVLRDDILRAGDHQKNYLAPENIDKVAGHVNDGQINIELSDEEKASAKANVARLQNLKTTKYDTVVNAQVESISTYLKGLKPEDRFKAHREIISAFVTISGYDKLSKEERLNFAVLVSNKTAETLIHSEVADVLDELNNNHNFIKLNQKIGKLSDAVAAVFGITRELSITVVSQFLKQAIEKKHGSFEHFTDAQLKSVDKVTDEDLKGSIDGIEKQYLELMENLVEKRDNICNGAVAQNASDTISLIKTVKTLKSEEEKLEKTLKTLDEKLSIVKKGKHLRRGVVPILETKEELLKARKENRRKHNKVIEDLGTKISEIHAINHGKDITFDVKDIQELRVQASKLLKEEVDLKSLEANLAVKNKYAFRAFEQFFSKVDSQESAEEQVDRVANTRSTIEDQTLRILNGWEKTRNFFHSWTYGLLVGPVDKVQTVSSTQVAKGHFANKNPINLGYQEFDAKQKGHYKAELEKQLGEEPVFLK